VYKFNLDKISL